MNSSQSLLRLFYKYRTDAILYLEDGKLKGYVKKQEVTESLSDISEATTDPVSLVHSVDDVDQALNFLEGSKIVENNKKQIPVINKKFNFVGLWERVDVIRSWENIPTITKWNVGHKVDNKIDPMSAQESIPENDGLNQKLAYLAMETLPIGMLAVSTLGEEILCNEDWLYLKKKHPKELTTKNIIYKAKNAMTEEAFKKNKTSPNMIFYLNNILKDQEVRMRLIRNKNKTIGYLFWKPEVHSNSEQKLFSIQPIYHGKNLDNIMAQTEKNILTWALEKTEGHISNASKILGVSRQNFWYKYRKHFK